MLHIYNVYIAACAAISMVDISATAQPERREIVITFNPEKVSYILVEKWGIPEGAQLVEAYETATQIVVCGIPNEEPDDMPDEQRHNCNYMGCSSVSHVLYRFNKS